MQKKTKEENNYFKDINEKLSAAIGTADKKTGPHERLEAYQALLAKTKSMYGHGEVQKSVEKVQYIRDQVGIGEGFVKGGLTLGTLGAVGTLVTGLLIPAPPVGSGLSYLVSVIVGSSTVAGVSSIIAGGFKALTNKEAKASGLTKADISYIKKTDKLVSQLKSKTNDILLQQAAQQREAAHQAEMEKVRSNLDTEMATAGALSASFTTVATVQPEKTPALAAAPVVEAPVEAIAAAPAKSRPAARQKPVVNEQIKPF